MVNFLFNDETVQADHRALKMSALEWIRTKKAHKGTKEGCASGDCGACTVLLGKRENKKMTYRSANACLLPLSALEGKHVLTIEALNRQDERHPVQKAMLDCHGAQCGFCTPGFIMSLYALYMNHKTYPGRDVVIEALSGNLCRCTGYKPILEAAKQAFSYPRVDFVEPASMAEQRQNIDKQAITHLPEQADFSPSHLATFFDLWQQYPKARLFAGATDSYLETTQQLKTPEHSIYLGGIKELMHIEQTAHNLNIGAAVSYSDLLPCLFALYPETQEVFSRLGSQQIRNQGTLGGSLGNASPIGDPAPFLLAVNASLTLISASGERIISIRNFFTGYKSTALQPGELIQSIIIPKKPDDAQLFFYKLSKRYEDDISTVCMALLLSTKNGKISQVNTGFGGMAATPKSAAGLESALTGAPFTEEAISQAVHALDDDFSPMSDGRASQQYRQQAAKNLVMRAFYASSGHTVRIHHA